MTTVKELRRDVEIVRRALAPREVDGRAEAIRRLLREYAAATEGMTAKEQRDLAKGVAADYAATRDECEKVFDPVTRGYVFRRKVKGESIH